MAKLQYIQADVTNPIGSGARIIPQCVNDLNIQGSGVARAIFTKWPIVKQRYHEWGDGKTNIKFQLGKVQLVQVEDDIWIASIIGQHGMIGPTNPTPIKYAALREGMETITVIAEQFNATIHAPKFGSSLAGGSWPIIELMIIEEWIENDIDVTIYEV